jgi:hypothetical protein
LIEVGASRPQHVCLDLAHGVARQIVHEDHGFGILNFASRPSSTQRSDTVFTRTIRAAESFSFHKEFSPETAPSKLP